MQKEVDLKEQLVQLGRAKKLIALRQDRQVEDQLPEFSVVAFVSIATSHGLVFTGSRAARSALFSPSVTAAKAIVAIPIRS
jgi:hypothetical protein